MADLPWFCILARFGQDRRVLHEVAELGFHDLHSFRRATYERRRVAECDGKSRKPHWRTRQVRIERPAFPGYLFVRLDLLADPWPLILQQPSVRGIVSSGSGPIRVQRGAVEYFAAQAESKGGSFDPFGHADRKGPPPCAEVGDMVTIASGPFTSFPAKCTWSDEDKAVFEVFIFGRHTPVELKAGQFEAA